MINFFTYKIENIREKKKKTMQPSTSVSDQGMHCRLPEILYLFVAIGEEEFCKLI